MKSLSEALIFEKNKLATPSAWIVLLEITLTDDTVFRFARNTEDVVFDGNTYTAFPFEIDSIGQHSKGEIPTVRLKISNVTQLIQPYLETLDGGIGSTVKVIVVNSAHLSETYTELEMTFDVIACNSTAQWVTFTLGAPNPLRQRFPLDQYIAMHCRWRFKSIECAYSGGETDCNRTFKRCRELNNTVRYGGFIGMRSGTVRVV